MTLKEIERKIPEDRRPAGENCPNCGNVLRWGSIGCPDGRLGCLVMHYGWHCDRCGKDYRNA